MRYLINNILGTIVFSICILTNAMTQCDFEGNLIIPDQSTISVDILVSGADNNELGVDNCLKIVNTHFDHNYLTDLTLELISPSGQSVILVGYDGSATDAPSTDLVLSWDVQFFNQDEMMAVPDQDHEQVWESNPQPLGWLAFNKFTGSYYPFSGGLESFTGSVNGLWTLVMTDDTQFADGDFYCFGLEFCNPEGIDVKSCSTVSSNLIEDDISLCEGSEGLDFIINPDLEETYDSSLYTYEYLIFKDDKFLVNTDNTDFSSYDAGQYTICGIHYFINDEPLVDNIPLDSSRIKTEEYLFLNAVCAEVSDNCIEVEVLYVPPVVTENRAICNGDSVIIGTEVFKIPGQYEIITPNFPCDSVSILNLGVVPTDIEIIASFDILSCENDSIILDASNSSSPVGSTSFWKTNNGRFVTSPLARIVTIDKPGTYIFELQNQGCVFEKEIEIGATEDYSDIEISFDTITCLTDSVLIDLSSSDGIVSFSWSAMDSFRRIGEDILVGASGTYSVDFVTEFNCAISREVTIEENIEYPYFDLQGGTITCQEPEINIYTLNTDTFNSEFVWLYDGEVLGNDTFQLVSEPGIYKLRVTTEDGCIDSFQTIVESEIDDFDVELIGGTIDCNHEIVKVSYTSSFDGLISKWTIPNGDIVIDSAFNVFTEGKYELELSNSEGCTLDTFLIIEKDFEYPEVNIQDALFQCGEDSIRLTPSTISNDLQYLWSNSNGYIDTLAMPWIFSPGQYRLEACLDNGCCAYDTIIVGVDIDAPVIDFEFQNLDCDNDTTFIIPSDTSTYDMSWQLNDVDLVVDSNIIMVTEAGFYKVRVTDIDNGCVSNYSFNIIEDKNSELTSVGSTVLNCQNSVVKIIVESTQGFDSYVWSGPGLLDSNLQPIVDTPGIYYLDYTFANGCMGRDSTEVLLVGELANLQGEDKVFNCLADSLLLDVTYESSTISLIWDGPNNFFGTGESVIVTEPGVYNVYGTAPGACKDTIMINVAADTLSPVLSIVNDGNITCVDSFVSIELTTDNTAISFSFEGTGIISQIDNIIEVDTPGIYTATAISANGCESVISTEIELRTDLPDYEKYLDSITCVVDEVNVGFTSNDPTLSVNWEGPESVADDLYNFTTTQEGSYKFTLLNIDGCEISDSLVVVRDTFPPNGGIFLSNQINCDFDEVTLTVENINPTWDIEWTGPGVVDPNAETVVTSEIGVYQLEIIGDNECVSIDEIEVVYDTTSAEIMILGNPITCLAGKVFLQIDSDLPIETFEWSGPNNFMSDEVEPLIIESGVYTVIATSANGCISSSEIFIDDEREYPSIEVEDYYLPCDGGPVLATYESISPGAVPRWFGHNDYFSNTDTAVIFEAGVYVGVAISEEGCATPDTFLVIDEPILPVFSAAGDLLLCFGPSELKASEIDEDESFVWKGPSGYSSVTNPTEATEPGIYTLYVTSNNGCTDSLDINIEDGRIYPDVEILLSQPFQCNNTEVILSSEGSSLGSKYKYMWTTEDGIITEGVNSSSPKVEGEGTYVLSIIDENIGCESRDTIVLMMEEQSLMDVVLKITPPSCLGYENGIIELTEIQGGFAPYRIMLDDSDYGERMDIPYLAVGEHYLLIIDSLGCEIDSFVTIDESTLLTVDLPTDTTLVYGQSLNVIADISLALDSIDQILWSSNVPCDGCTSFEFIPNSNMTVSIEVMDINGCISMEEFRITVNRPNNLPFPQIFSPDGNGVNDMFYLPMTTGIEGIDYIRIYDNWGGLLYEKNNIKSGDESNGWNGQVNGQNAEIGVYIVEAIVTLVDGTKVRYVSDLTLIR